MRSPTLSRAELCCLAGFTCYWSWVFCALLTNLFAPNEALGPLDDTWLLSTLAHAATLLVVGFCSGKLAPYRERPFLHILTPCLMIAGFAVLLLSSNEMDEAESHLALIAGCLLSGVGTGLYLALWAEMYSLLGSDNRKQTLLFLAVISSTALDLLLSLLPDFALWIALLLLPIAGIAFVHRAPAKGVAETDRAGDEKDCERLSPRFAAYCLVFPIPLGLFQSWFATEKGTLGEWTPILLAAAALLAAILAIELWLFRSKKLSFAEKLVMPIMVAGLFVLVTLDGLSLLIAGMLVYTAQQIMSVVLYSRFGIIASRGDLEPSRVFAIGVITTDCGFVIGMFAGQMADSVFQNHALTLVLGLAYVMILVAFLNVAKLPIGKGDEAPRGAAPANAKSETNALAQQHALTPREREILDCLLKGKSVPAIAAEVFLSASTVRTHVRHIYQKFDVHSRDELIAVIEEACCNDAISPDGSPIVKS